MATSRTASSKKTTTKIASGTPAKKPLAKKVSAPKSAKAAATAKSAPGKSVKKSTVSPEERYKMIAAAAYLRAEQRGFRSGHALDDWIAAEAEIDAMLKA